MSFTARNACDAKDDHDGKLHAGCAYALADFDGLRAVDAFADIAQGLGIAGFHAVVEDLQACFTKLGQFFHGLSEDISRSGVRCDSFQVREIFLERIQDFQKTFGFENKRIAVSEEYAADTIAVDGVSHGDLAHDFFIGKFFKLDAAVHVAVSAVVVRASTSHAEDEAFCFTRRTVNWGFVVVKK